MSGSATVITGSDIDRYRLYAIRSVLRLEAAGMRGKIKASTIARQILNKAGLKASRNKKELFVQFCEYLKGMEG